VRGADSTEDLKFGAENIAASGERYTKKRVNVSFIRVGAVFPKIGCF
jgi:hypothetical protein